MTELNPSAEALELCRMLPLLEVGILPCAGGWRDQAAVWCDGTRFALNERASYQQEAQRGG